MFLTRAALAIALVAGAGTRARAVTINCHGCVVPFAGAKLSVTGTVSTDTLAVDLVGHLATWKVGSVVLHDVVITAHDRGETILACVAGKAGVARVLACSSLPRSFERLGKLGAADIRWKLTGETVRGRGTGRVAWTGSGGPRLESARGELAVPAQTYGELSTGVATITAALVADRAGGLEMTGRAHLATADAGPLHLRDIELPLAFHVSPTLQLSPHAPLVARARTASLGIARIEEAAVVVHDASPFHAAALLRDPHRLSWRAIRGLPIGVGPGSATLRGVDAGVKVEDTRAAALGADVAIDPFVIDAREHLDLNVRIRGLAVAHVLTAATRGRVEGTGTLDADLVVHHDDAGFTVDHATVHARGPGVLRVRDAAWRDRLARSVTKLALARRIASTLADFTYDRLSVRVAPSGTSRDAVVALHGRGTKLPQELDLAINVSGARATANRLLTRVDR